MNDGNNKRIQGYLGVPVGSLPLTCAHTLVATYESATEAERKTGISRGGILRCCKGRYSQAKGYVWKYINIIDI